MSEILSSTPGFSRVAAPNVNPKPFQRFYCAAKPLKRFGCELTPTHPAEAGC
jgi:hypothetical protein